MLWKHLPLMGILLGLLLGQSSCSSMHTLTASSIPQRGWTAFQVETALGPSSHKSFSDYPLLQIWRYGVSSAAMGFGPLMVLPRCDYLSSTCLILTLQDGRVTNVQSTVY